MSFEEGIRGRLSSGHPPAGRAPLASLHRTAAPPPDAPQPRRDASRARRRGVPRCPARRPHRAGCERRGRRRHASHHVVADGADLVDVARRHGPAHDHDHVALHPLGRARRRVRGRRRGRSDRDAGVRGRQRRGAAGRDRVGDARLARWSLPPVLAERARAVHRALDRLDRPRHAGARSCVEGVRRHRVAALGLLRRVAADHVTPLPRRRSPCAVCCVLRLCTSLLRSCGSGACGPGREPLAGRPVHLPRRFVKLPSRSVVAPFRRRR